MNGMKNSLVSLGLVLSGGLLFLASASAEPVTVKGFVNTLSCAEEGTICPIDRLDPHIAASRDFVLQERQVAGEFYFLPNLPRDTKVRYVLEEVEVTGELNRRYNSIEVQEFRVKRAGTFRTVWSPSLQAREYQQLTPPGSSPTAVQSGSVSTGN